MLTSSQFAAFFPAAHSTVVALYYPYFVSMLPQYGLNLPIEEAHFYAQVGHESGDLRYAEEIASGAAYEGRKSLGNTEIGDGVRFKGRGFIQLTGRSNYTIFGRYKSRDFLTGSNPELIASEPALCVEVAPWYWRNHSINRMADRDDIEAVTRAINGGLNGLQDRAMRLARCKQVLGI